MVGNPRPPKLDAEVVELLDALTLDLQLRTLELRTLIESVVAGCASRERIRIDHACAEHITVLADRARLRFALVALLRMILTCSAPHSRISVTAVQRGSRTTISFAARAQPREPHSVAIEITRQIAEAHGGSASAQAIGDVVTWSVELPSPSRTARRWPRGSSVLLVDDNHEQVTALAEVLRIEGLAAECATSGCEAIERLAVRLPDFLIVDVQLPDYNGVDLIAHARSLRPALPAALLTGYPRDHPLIAHAIATSQSAYLSKPVDVDTLLDLVANAVRQ